MSPPSWLGGNLVSGPPPAPPGPPVTGYQWWLDATQPGNTNHVWKDNSGNGYNATALATGSYVDPVLTAGAVNGLAAYQFPGGAGTCCMNTTGFNIGASFTLFCVFKAISYAQNAAPLDASYSGGYSMDYGNPYGYEFWVGAHDYLSNTTPDTNVHCMTIAFSTATNGYRCYQDGVLSYTGTASFSYPSQVRSVGMFVSYSSQTWDGYVCEIAEYATLLSDPEIASNHTYLGTKWGF